MYTNQLLSLLVVQIFISFSLHKIGTDPKEARYWLRQFQTHESSPDQPFAVVQVDSEIMRDEAMVSSAKVYTVY